METRAVAERAALVALLRLPSRRWSETALEIQETGSALRVLDHTVEQADSLFPEIGTVHDLVAATATDVAG